MLSPCFVCSWHRRKALFQTAREQRCAVVALGHHKDDIAETLLLNLMWQGRHETMLPRQPLFDGELTLIRPLAMVDESELSRLSRLGNLPAHSCPCPYGRRSQRETVAEIIRIVRRAGNRSVTDNLLRSASSAGNSLAGHEPPAGKKAPDALSEV
jgi:tRNA(Ile)-lysidine synthase TilS/MesJ